MSEMLKKVSPLEFDDLMDNQYEAYHNIKDHLVSLLALQSKANKQCISDTASSATQLSCARLQEQEFLK